MKHDFCRGYDSTGNAPLLLFNATDAATGQRVVLTPAKISGDVSAVYPVQEKPSLHFSLTTAAFLSARFPLVSPAGELDFSQKRTLTLVDGGYVDNTGTETLVSLISELLRATPRRAYSLIILMPKFSEESVQQKLGIPGNFETLPIVDALLKSRSLLSSSSEKLTSLVQNISEKVACAFVEIQLRTGSSVPLGWCLTRDNAEELDRVLQKKLPGSEPADPFPPRPVDIVQTYSKSLEIESNIFNGNGPRNSFMGVVWYSFYKTGWPDYGEDAIGLVPQVFTMQAADLPEFMRKWCGVSVQTAEKPFVIQDAVQVLTMIRQARKNVLENQFTPVTRSDLIGEAMDFWPRSEHLPQPPFSEKSLSLFSFNDGFKEYLEYSRAILTKAGRPKQLQGWPTELDQRCRKRWEQALENYDTALRLLSKIHGVDAQQTKFTIIP